MELNYGKEYIPSEGTFEGLDNYSLQIPQSAAPRMSSASAMGEGLSGAGDMAMAGAAVPGPQQPFVAAGGLALKGLGTVAGLYGKYKEREEAKEQYKQQLEMWKKAERERKKRQALEDRRRERQEGYFASDFAQDLEDRFQGNYGGYRAPGGA